MEFDFRSVRHRHFIDNARRGCDQVEVELAAEAFLDDFEMQQAEKAAAEAHAERGRGFHLPCKACIIQAQLAHRRAQIVKVARIHRKQAAEDDRLNFLIAGQGLVTGSLVFRDRITHGRFADFLDRSHEVADFARPKRLNVGEFRIERADLVNFIDAAGAHHLDLLLLLQHAIMNAHDDDHAEIGVVIGVHQGSLQRRVDFAGLWRRQALDNGFQRFRNAETGLGRRLDGVRGIKSDHVLDLGFHALDVSSWQIDLVQNRHDLMVLVDGLIDVCQRLRLDALGGVHDQ